MEKKASLPLLLKIIEWICLIAWAIVLVGILRSDVSISEGYQNAPALFWIGGACLILWLILWGIGKLKRSKVENSEEFTEHMNEYDGLTAEAKQELGIPDHAIGIDILAERYIVKNGKVKHKDFPFAQYLNFEQYIFEENGNICLSDLEQVWEIPLTSFRSITFVKKRVNFPFWNKEESFNSPKYKPYKITSNNMQYFAHYYRVEICDLQGDFYLLIPEYDGEAFMKLTDLRPKEA